jgi:hypothetical protein
MPEIRDVVWAHEAGPSTTLSGDNAESGVRDPVQAGEARDEAANVQPISGSAAQTVPSRQAASRRASNEWTKAKESFVSIMDEAGAAIQVFDQEKRRILGLTHALTQIQQSFDGLHLRFTDMEKTLTTGVGDYRRLDQRLDEIAAAVAGCEDNDGELLKDNAALRTAISQLERRQVQHTEAVASLTEDNRKLRERLSAMDRDSGLIVDEIARIRNELITLNEQGCGAETNAPASERRSEGSVPSRGEDTGPRGRSGEEFEHTALASLVSDLADALEIHKRELGRLKDRIDSAPEVEVSAPPRVERVFPDIAERAPSQPSRTASLGRLLDSTPAMEMPEPEETPIRLQAPPQQPAPEQDDEDFVSFTEQGTVNLVVPTEASAETPLPTAQASRESIDVNALCSVFERRSMELRAELMRERRDRQLAENALQFTRNERAQLQRELARMQGKQLRSAPQDDPHEPPLDPPEPANRDYIPVQSRRI